MLADQYPQVEVNLEKLRENTREIVSRCAAKGVEVAGVIKGCNGIPEVALAMAQEGCSIIASSRLEQLEGLREKGLKKQLMLIRIPMISEAQRVVSLTDISLNSEEKVLEALNLAAQESKKIHKVILMADLGDLREGFWDKDRLMACGKWIEEDLENLQLIGIATNLCCYGSVLATKEKMEELVALAERLEATIGRKIQYVGGGATTTLPLVFNGTLPPRINLLRIGEAIIMARDLEDSYGHNMSFMNQDVFTLKGEIIEVKHKPSYPVGELGRDAFAEAPVFEDIGIRRKALVALGRVDHGGHEGIYPLDKNIRVLGSSSDHTILDITDCEKDYQVGDIVDFNLFYGSLVYSTASRNVHIKLTRA